jgi:hypothetical protein
MWTSTEEKGTKGFCYDKKTCFCEHCQTEMESVVQDEWWRERKSREEEESGNVRGCTFPSTMHAHYNHLKRYTIPGQE